MVNVHATLGARLRWAREYAGLSLGQVRMIAVYAEIARWEADELPPHVDTVASLSDLYMIELDYLLHGKERADDPDTERALARSRVSDADRAEVLTFLRRARVRRG